MATVANNPIITPGYEPLTYFAGGAVTLATAGVIFGPFEAVRIVGTTVLTAAAYGIANDMIACRDCIEYFTVGHWFAGIDGRDLDARPLQTLDPNINAVAWGVIATWHVATVAGIILATAAQLPLPFVATTISAGQLLPFLAIGSVATLALGQLASMGARRIEEREHNNPYHGVPEAFQSRWAACSSRNAVGYLCLSTLIPALVIGTIATRILF